MDSRIEAALHLAKSYPHPHSQNSDHTRQQLDPWYLHIRRLSRTLPDWETRKHRLEQQLC